MESISPKLEELNGSVLPRQQSRFDIIFQKRYIHSAMLGLCLFVAYLSRLNLSVAIVSMTDNKSSNEDFYEFAWDEQEKGLILSSFYWGYVISQIPAGQLAQFISPKLLLTVTNLISSLASFLTPVAAYYGGWKLFVAVRVIQGICQGFIPPILYKMASNWIPPLERSRLLGFSLSGATAASLGFPFSGALAQSSAGWPSIFYGCAILNLLWIIMWIWIGADSPTTHKTISPEEKNYIETSLMNCLDFGRKMKTPWIQIFTSIPFWALLITDVCDGFARFLMMNEIPSFINGILGVGIELNSFLSGFPYYLTWLLIFPVCWLADYLQKKAILSKCAVRKLCTTLTMSGSCLVLLFIGFFADEKVPFMIVLSASVILHAFLFSSFVITPLDLAPNFAAVLNSLVNTAESVAALSSPIVVGLVVDNPNSMAQWWTAFLIMTCVAVTGNIIYLIFGSTDLQKWNSPD